MSSPGHNFKVEIQCDVISKSQTKSTTIKVFNISVIDVNDNFIKVQDPQKNLTLKSPYFEKVKNHEKI
jgi:hypothetical protein